MFSSFPGHESARRASQDLCDIYIYIYHTRRSLIQRFFSVPAGLDLTTDATGVFNSTLTRDIALPVNATVEDLDSIPLSEVQGFKEPALPWYSDQALPFDITMAAANEYGAAASCELFGVEILNEGFGSSVDDSVLEMQATFVACSVATESWPGASFDDPESHGRTRCFVRAGPVATIRICSQKSARNVGKRQHTQWLG